MNTLNIEHRNTDRNINELRNNGVVPGVFMGPSVGSNFIKMEMKTLKKALNKPGEIYEIPSGNGTYFAKFDEIQKDPVSRKPIHFSLLQLPRGKRNTVDIPVKLKGVPVGVRKGGTLVVLKDEVNINGVPREIPDLISANVSKLDIGDKLTVNDLKIPNRVESTDADNDVIAICTPPNVAEAAVEPDELETKSEDTKIGKNPAMPGSLRLSAIH
jgi:large subunit ribosomal protein L25